MTCSPCSEPTLKTLAAVLLAVALLAGCAAKDTGPTVTALPAVSDEFHIPPEAGPIADSSVPELLSRKTTEQYSDLGTIYTPPARGFQDMVIRLAQGRRRIALATGVKDFSGGSAGLAVAFSDNRIAVVSPWPCHSLVLPGANSPEDMPWDAPGRILGVLEEGRETLRLFDLNACGEISRLDLDARAVQAAVSRTGNLVAVSDMAHALLLGPATGPLRRIASLRYTTLAMRFTPAEGLLLVADHMGWLSTWSTDTGEQRDTWLVPGGPFASARFEDRTLIFDGDNGPAAWDIPAMHPTTPPGPEETPDFILENEMLLYIPNQQSLIKSMILGRPRPRADVSRSLGLLRIKDMDDTFHYYTVMDGEPAQPAETDDWTPLPLDNAYRFTLGEKHFVLADAVHREGDWVLFSRNLPGNGFYLWWERTDTPVPVEFPRGTLPVRTAPSLEHAPDTLRILDPA